MKKILILILITLFSGNIFAQVNVSFDCSKLSVPFTVNFMGNFAILKMRGSTYKMSYSFGHVNQNGEKWSVYQTSELSISTTYPVDSFVSVIATPFTPITAGSCQK